LFHIRGLYDEGEGEGRDSQDGEGVDDDTEHQDEEGTDEVEEQQDDGMPPLEKVPQNADVADEDEEEHDDDLPPLEEVSQNADVADSENNGDIGGKRPGLVPPVSHTTATSAQVMAKEQGMESHETKDDTAGDGRADLHNSLDITTANEGPKSAHEQVLDEEKNREKQETEGHTDSNSDTSSDQVEPPPFDHITDLWDPYLFSDAEPDSDSDDESIGVLYPPFLGTLRTCLIEAVHMHRYQDVSQRINELEDKSEEFKKSIEEYKNSTALQSIYAFFGGVIVGGLLILKWPGLVGVMKGQYFGSD
jgi:hypothetical protein